MMTTRLSRMMRPLMLAFAGIVLAAAAATAGPAQIVIVNVNAPGVGFNDPTPATPMTPVRSLLADFTSRTGPTLEEFTVSCVGMTMTSV